MGTSCSVSLIPAPSLESAEASLLVSEGWGTLLFVLDESVGPLLVSMAHAKEGGARSGTSACERIQKTDEVA
jgi:hypothetical protein